MRFAALLALFLTLVGLGFVSRTAGAVAAPAGGERLYLRDCAFCHGSDARGTVFAPSLQGAGRASLHYYVSTGRMPLLQTGRAEVPGRPREPLIGRFAPDAASEVRRHHSPYSQAEIEALIDYTLTLAGNDGPDVGSLDLTRGDASRGGELFRLNCAACHSWAGEGGALLHREAPELHSASALQTAEAVRVGPGAMPSFGDAALSDGELRDVVAYVRSLDATSDPGGSALWHLGPVAEGAVAILVGMGSLVALVRWMGERG